jgi:hypothetical protein
MAERDRVLRHQSGPKSDRAAVAPRRAGHPLLGLQRTIGNRGTVELLRTVQPKPEVDSGGVGPVAPAREATAGPAVIRRRIGFELETGIPLTKRSKLKGKNEYVYKDIVPSDVGGDLPAPGGKLLPDHIPGKPPHAEGAVERFEEWPIIEYVTDPVDDTLKMDAFEVIARQWIAEIARIKTLAKGAPPAKTLKAPYVVGLPSAQAYADSDWDRIAPQATVGVPLDQVGKVLGAFDKNKGGYGDQLATQFSQQAPSKAAIIMQGLIERSAPAPGDGAAMDGIKALLTMLINHLLCGGHPEISKTSYIKNRPVNVMFKTKLSTVRNNLTATAPYAATTLGSAKGRARLKSDLISATGRTEAESVFIEGQQRNNEQKKVVKTASSTVTVGAWIDQVLKGIDDDVFNEMKNEWATELTPDATNEMVIELRKLGSFVEHSNYTLEDDDGLLGFLKKVYGAHQVYKQRML